MTEEEIAQIKDVQKALEVVGDNGYNYYYLNSKLKNDRAVALTAVRQEVEAMASVPNKFREDKSFVMEAINFHPMLVEYIHPKLQDNLHLMLFAVTENGYALEHASERLKNNPKIVLAAIKNDPEAIQYASQQLQDIAGSSPEENITQFCKTGKLFKSLQKDLKSSKDSPKKIKI